MYACEITNAPILCLVKISVLLFLNRLCGIISRFKYAIWILLAFNVGVLIGTVVPLFFQCLPVAFTWDKTIPNGHCFKVGIFVRYTMSFKIATDILVVAVAVWMFSSIKIQMRVKLMVIGIFALGIL